MKKIILVLAALLSMATMSYAIPVLQIGAPGVAGEGTYADYQKNLSNPTETDTAVTSAHTIYVAGVYGNSVDNLGGQFSSGTVSGNDWSFFGLPSTDFNGRGAILVASVANGSTGTLTVNGVSSFYSDSENSYFPNNHDPVRAATSDFLFFDIGNFSKNASVPNFSDETGSAKGEIKTLAIVVTGYEWVHFDVMALETDITNKKTIKVNTDIQNDPGSKDVTWKDATPVPEPGTIVLFGAGLLGLAAYGRKRIRK